MNSEVETGCPQGRWVPSVGQCFIPIGISVLCGLIFTPIRFAEADVFSLPMCILSGIMLTEGLLVYRSGRLKNARWLAIMVITFIYECVPINLPTSFDDMFALSANGVNMFFMHVFGISWTGPNKNCSSTTQQDILLEGKNVLVDCVASKLKKLLIVIGVFIVLVLLLIGGIIYLCVR